MGGQPGVYAIVCKATGEVYVGSSTDVVSRLRAHRASLRWGTHHNRALQSAWERYGEGAFEFKVLENMADSDLLTQAEATWMDRLAARQRGVGFHVAPPGRRLVIRRAGLPDVGEPFGAVLSELREVRGLSMAALAKAAGLSRPYVHQIETGKRQAPSPRVARALVRALALHGEDRRRVAEAFTRLTGQHLEEEPEGTELLDQRELAALLVRNTAFPAHSLDRLWDVAAWNEPAVELFEMDAGTLDSHSRNLLAVVFDPAYRARFRPWEGLARHLLADFKHSTRSLTYLPQYRELWRTLRALPDFRRIADSADAGSVIAPSFVFQMRHSRLGPLTLRTAITVFSGASDYSIVTYVPGDQQTLEIFAANGWQAGPQGGLSRVGFRERAESDETADLVASRQHEQTEG